MKNSEEKLLNNKKKIPLFLIYVGGVLVAAVVVWAFLKINVSKTSEFNKLENCINKQLMQLNNPDLTEFSEVENKCFKSLGSYIASKITLENIVLEKLGLNQIIDKNNSILLDEQCAQRDKINKDVQDRYRNIVLSCSKEVFGEKEALEMINKH